MGQGAVATRLRGNMKRGSKVAKKLEMVLIPWKYKHKKGEEENFGKNIIFYIDESNYKLNPYYYTNINRW